MLKQFQLKKILKRGQVIYFGNIKRSNVSDVHIGWSVSDNTNELFDNEVLISFFHRS